MFFASDNWSGVSPEIAEALSRAATDISPAYGTSAADVDLELRFNDLFEREVAVFFVGTGTAANCLALSAVNRPGGFVMCHREAHLIEDECGAPEFFTGGARLAPIDGPRGKISPANLQTELDRFDPAFVHHGQPMAVSITQATEVGSVYSVDEIREISGIARRFKLPLHMDGARFANAMVHLNVSPAEMTWRSGVDVLSFGATKNGCWCAEAIVFFDLDRAKQMPFIRKRAAQLFSKTRFIASQFHAYLDEDLWIRSARHANRMARRLAEGLSTASDVELAWPPESNELFIVASRDRATDWMDAGAKFYPWPTPHDGSIDVPAGRALYRLVTSFATTETHVDDFVKLVNSAVPV